MSRWFLVATRSGVYSFDSSAPGAPLAAREVGLEDEWVWVSCAGGVPGRAYVGTKTGGAFITQDSGTTWAPLAGGAIPAEYVRGLAVPDGEPDLVYVGTEPAGVWRHDMRSGDLVARPMDSAKTFPTWSFPDPPHIAHVKDLTVAPGSTSSIFAAVEVGGVLRSDDGGETWSELLDGIDTDAHFLAIDRHVDGRVFCATGKSVYISEDRGDHWKAISEPLSRYYTSLLTLHPSIPDLIYVAATDGPPPEWFSRDTGADAKLFISEDGGRSFVEVEGGLPELSTVPYTSLIVDPDDRDVLYLAAGDGTIRVSRDVGRNWEILHSGLPPIQHLTLSVPA